MSERIYAKIEGGILVERRWLSPEDARAKGYADDHPAYDGHEGEVAADLVKRHEAEKAAAAAIPRKSLEERVADLERIVLSQTGVR